MALSIWNWFTPRIIELTVQFNAKDLRKLPLLKRKSILEKRHNKLFVPELIKKHGTTTMTQTMSSIRRSIMRK
jgi:hypothetical protein